jgi:hypothetical protein
VLSYLIRMYLKFTPQYKKEMEICSSKLFRIGKRGYFQTVRADAKLSPNFKLFKKPKIRFQGIHTASSLAGRYDNPVPTRVLALIDCLKISALILEESKLVLLNSFIHGNDINILVIYSYMEEIIALLLILPEINGSLSQ